VKRLSEQLSELSARTKRTEDVIDAARDRNRERLHTQQAALASAVDAQRATLSEQAGHAQANAKSTWQELRSAVDARFATIRANSAQHRANRDRVERRADAAELDAVDAVEFALYALQEAEYAIVEAAIARADADDLVRQP
jgi:hypothetical protein